MNRIENKFAELKKVGETAIVGFITAGDPYFDKSVEIVKLMCKGGLDVLELGVPFSDPTSDGAAIQRSSQRALAAGMNLEKCFELVRKVREESEIPVILFSYYNPIFHYGAARFCAEARAAGADGVLIVDLPPEESSEITDDFTEDFSVIRLIAPTTPSERIGHIVDGASGFLYVISMTGVTGNEIKTDHLKEYVDCIRSHTDMPLCVGFGISTPAQAAAVAKLADGVVIGSAFERLIEDNLEDEDVAKKMQRMVCDIKDALK